MKPSGDHFVLLGEMQSKAGVAWPVGPVGSEDHAATGGGAHPPALGRASRRGRFERALAPLAQSRAGGRAWPQDVFCFHLARRPRAWNELQPITSRRVPGLQPADVGESPRGAIEERAPLRPPRRPASCELSFYPQQPSLM